MKKGKIAIIIIVAGIIIIGASTIIYRQVKKSESNEALKVSEKLMAEGNFDKAQSEIDIAKTDYENNPNIKKVEEELKSDISNQKIYKEGLEIEKSGDSEKAIEVLKTVDNSAVQTKEAANNEIKNITNNNEEKDINEAKEDIKNLNLDDAREEIENIAKIDPNNSEIEILNNEIKNIFSNNEYVGIGNNEKITHPYTKDMGTYTLIVNYYNPENLTKETFLKYYKDKIYPTLKHNVLYDLIDINKPGYGLIFQGNGVNEVDNFGNGLVTHEFNKGKIGSNGNAGMDPKGQYCAMSGNEIFAYYSGPTLSGQTTFTFTFE